MSKFSTERSKAFRETLRAGAGEELTLVVGKGQKGVTVWSLVNRKPMIDTLNRERIQHTERNQSVLEIPLCELQIEPRVGITFKDCNRRFHRCDTQPTANDVAWTIGCYTSEAEDAE